jgi:5-methylthioadenosine/S-adenosylhomocysteine deaminase
MTKILIRNAGWVVTMDADRRIFVDGAVAIEDDRIVAVGKNDQISAQFKAEKVIDADDKLVLPGLIDTYVHNTQQLGRGLADGCEINVHLLERLYGYETAMMQEDAYWAALCCQLELIRAGTTCFIDPGSYFPQETAKAIGESGLRGVIARTALCRPTCRAHAAGSHARLTPIYPMLRLRSRQTFDAGSRGAQL